VKVRPKREVSQLYGVCAIFLFIATEEQSPLGLQEAVFMAAGVFQNLIVCAMMSCSNTIAAAIDKGTPSVLRSHGLCVY